MQALVIANKEVRCDGHVYVVEVAPGVCKVGATNNPKTRFSALRSVLPDGFINTFISERANHYMKLERACHLALADSRIKNEVFRVSFIDAVLAVQKEVAQGHVPAPKVQTALPSEGAVHAWGLLIAQIQGVATRERCLDAGFSEATALRATQLNPEAARIALAAHLCGEEPNVGLGYAYTEFCLTGDASLIEAIDASFERKSQAASNAPCADECERAARNVASLLR